MPTGYVIEKRLTETEEWEKVETVDASVTLYCVENLKEKSEYEFRVYAENPVGLSEEAAHTEFVLLKTHASKNVSRLDKIILMNTCAIFALVVA